VGYQPVHESVANSVPLDEPAVAGTSRLDGCLLVETALALVFAVLTIRVIAQGAAYEVGWLLNPIVLVAAAFVPTTLRRRRFADFGLTGPQILRSLAVLGWTCLALFPLVLAGLWVLNSYDLGVPLQPSLPQEKGLIGWVFYQFMYVAMAEEVFFRGYVQSNIMRLAGPATGDLSGRREWVIIVLSAACFAIGHLVVQGQAVSLLTFLPGLVLGWLFIRTKSLLAPILFHGLANICYAAMASLFV